MSGRRFPLLRVLSPGSIPSLVGGICTLILVFILLGYVGKWLIFGQDPFTLDFLRWDATFAEAGVWLFIGLWLVATLYKAAEWQCSGTPERDAADDHQRYPLVLPSAYPQAATTLDPGPQMV